MINEKKLVHEFVSERDELAFRRLYQYLSPQIYGISLRLNNLDENAANELLQQTWIRAIEKIYSFQWKSTFKTWLTGMMINIHREQYRKRKEQFSLSHIKSQVSGIEKIINQIDLENAISELPDGYKEIIILHDIEGYKHKEIAELLDISEGTSKSQLFYARQKIRKYLTEENKNTEAS